MKKLMVSAVGLMLLLISGASIRAQEAVPPPGPAGPALTPDQLDQLAGPIALYPDPLIAEILPAATFPSQIVMADRYVGQGGDPNLIADQGWDPSIQAMAHYPNVLKWMDDNLAWTTQLGQAFVSQQADVMNAIQQLRAKAQSLGNLPTTPQESVVTDDGDIQIEPVNPDQMYVPSYEPDQIFYQPGVYCAYPFFLPLGGWLVHDWNRHDHGLIHWGPGHPRPNNWWHESPGERHSYIVGHREPVWHAGAGTAQARGSWQRGFESPVNRSFAPRETGSSVTVIHSMPTTFRNVPAFSRPAPQVEHHAEVRGAPAVERHEEVRSAPARGSFVGGQSGREAEQASSRGQSSRAAIGGGATASHGGGGGGHR